MNFTNEKMSGMNEIRAYRQFLSMLTLLVLEYNLLPKALRFVIANG